MTKPKTIPVIQPTGDVHQNHHSQPEPLSGSKQAKNHQHSKQRNGEGS